MNRARRVAVVIALLGVAGCGRATESLYPFHGGAPPTQAQLQSALVTVGDMPPGFSPKDDSENSDDNDSRSAPDACGSEGNVGDAAAEAKAQFIGDSFGPAVIVQLGSFPDSRAEKAVDLLRDQLKTCTTYTRVDSDGNRTEYSVKPLSFPHLADDTVALRMEGSDNGIPVAAEVVLIRQGDVLALIANGGIAGTVNTAKTTEVVARKQAEKLVAAF